MGALDAVGPGRYNPPLVGSGASRALLVEQDRIRWNMAQHKSAKKRIRRNERRQDINRTRVSRLRTVTRKTEAAIASGDKASAESAFRAMQPVLQSAVTKGAIRRNTVSRKLSRLSARIKAL